MPTLRRTLFFLFCLIYIICCPLIILDVLGINLNPRGAQNLGEKTGIISVSSLPPGATIYLDNLRFSEKTNAVIRNLTPGPYSIKLFLKDHKLWEKTVPVEGEKATVLENVLLIEQKWSGQPLSSLSFEEIIPIQNNSLFLLKKGPLVQDFFLCRITERLPENLLPTIDPSEKHSFLAPLFLEDTTYSEAKVISYFTVPESTFILMHINLKGNDQFLWVDLKPNPPLIEDITNLIIKKPKKILWERHDSKNIFVYRDDTVTRLETAKKAIYPKVADHVLGWGIYNQKIYTLSQDHILQKSNYDGKDPEFISNDLSFVLSRFGENTKYQIHVFTGDLILMLGEHGELLTNKFPPLLIERDVRNFDLDEETQRLLFWTEHKLGVVDFSLNTPDKELNPKLAWLSKAGKDIEQAFWVNHNSYILYRDQDKIGLMETEKFNDPVGQEIFTVKRNSPVVYSETTGKLYYLDAETHQLSALTIVPVADRFTFSNRKDKEQP